MLALCAALCVCHPETAHAKPPPVATASGQTFTLFDLGTPGPLAFYGDQGTAELTFPVSRGLLPATLNATIETPVNVRSGLIAVTQKDRTIARVPLPLTDQAQIVIPLAGAAIDDNAVTVTLQTSLVPVEGYCLDPTRPLRLTNGSVTFSGSELAPASVADFLPPFLRKLTIAIPAAPAKAESDAAVGLAAAVSAYYGQQPTAIVVTKLGSSLPAAGPFERQIAIQQGPDSGVALQRVPGALPNLRISGPEGELTNQSRLLTSDISRLALSSKAVVGPLKKVSQLAGNVTTLRALGQPVVSAVALSPQVALGVDQTRMGRPAKDVRVQLIGSYTPPPDAVAARLAAIVGGETVDTWSVDGTGLIDRWVAVPDRLLQRYTTLGISLNIAGNTGRCGEFQPLTLTINGDSVVQSAAADPPVPGGLQALPQALMPRTLVGIRSESFADTVRATALAVAMQRLSALPIDTAVTSVEEALVSPFPAIIVSPDGWDHPEMTLPVSADGARLSLEGMAGDGQSTTLALNPDLRYGTLQSFVAGGRSVLVATSNAASGQLDALLRWMSDDPRRWSQLDGTAVIAAPGQEPVVVGPQPGIGGPVTDNHRDVARWWVGGVLAAAAVSAAALMALRSRRRR